MDSKKKIKTNNVSLNLNSIGNKTLNYNHKRANSKPEKIDNKAYSLNLNEYIDKTKNYYITLNEVQKEKMIQKELYLKSASYNFNSSKMDKNENSSKGKLLNNRKNNSYLFENNNYSNAKSNLPINVNNDLLFLNDTIKTNNICNTNDNTSHSKINLITKYSLKKDQNVNLLTKNNYIKPIKSSVFSRNENNQYKNFRNEKSNSNLTIETVKNPKNKLNFSLFKNKNTNLNEKEISKFALKEEISNEYTERIVPEVLFNTEGNYSNHIKNSSSIKKTEVEKKSSLLKNELSMNKSKMINSKISNYNNEKITSYLTNKSINSSNASSLFKNHEEYSQYSVGDEIVNKYKKEISKINKNELNKNLNYKNKSNNQNNSLRKLLKLPDSLLLYFIHTWGLEEFLKLIELKQINDLKNSSNNLLVNKFMGILLRKVRNILEQISNKTERKITTHECVIYLDNNSIFLKLYNAKVESGSILKSKTLNFSINYIYSPIMLDDNIFCDVFFIKDQDKTNNTTIFIDKINKKNLTTIYENNDFNSKSKLNNRNTSKKIGMAEIKKNLILEFNPIILRKKTQVINSIEDNFNGMNECKTKVLYLLFDKKSLFDDYDIKFKSVIKEISTNFSFKIDLSYKFEIEFSLFNNSIGFYDIIELDIESFEQEKYSSILLDSLVNENNLNLFDYLKSKSSLISEHIPCKKVRISSISKDKTNININYNSNNSNFSNNIISITNSKETNLGKLNLNMNNTSINVYNYNTYKNIYVIKDSKIDCNYNSGSFIDSSSDNNTNNSLNKSNISNSKLIKRKGFNIIENKESIKYQNIWDFNSKINFDWKDVNLVKSSTFTKLKSFFETIFIIKTVKYEMKNSIYTFKLELTFDFKYLYTKYLKYSSLKKSKENRGKNCFNNNQNIIEDYIFSKLIVFNLDLNYMIIRKNKYIAFNLIYFFDKKEIFDEKSIDSFLNNLTSLLTTYKTSEIYENSLTKVNCVCTVNIYNYLINTMKNDELKLLKKRQFNYINSNLSNCSLSNKFTNSVSTNSSFLINFNMSDFMNYCINNKLSVDYLKETSNEYIIRNNQNLIFYINELNIK